MNIRKLTAVGVRLEKSVGAQSDHNSMQDYYDHLEQVAIAILDSEFEDYPDGQLESYLLKYLTDKRLELGLDFK